MSDAVSELPGLVRETLDQIHHPANRPIIVALSGGLDSQVLCHALIQVASETGHSIQPVHVDHGLRTNSSDDADQVRGVCESWGIPCEVVSVDVGAWDSVLQQGVESAARAARYAALASVAKAYSTDLVVTGHTLDDQVETMLLRLALGTGLEGLCGMKLISTRSVPLSPEHSSMRRMRVFRPLLSVSRAQVEAYAGYVGIDPIEDESNRNTTYRRNAIRHTVVPPLEAIEPNFRESIARTAGLLQDDASFIADVVDETYAEVVAQRGPVSMIERQRFTLEHDAVQRRVLYRVVEPLLPASARLGRERLEALRIAAVNGQPGKIIEIADDIVAYVDYDRVAIGKSPTLEDDLRRLSWVPLLEPGTEIELSGAVDVSLMNGWRIRGDVEEGHQMVLRTRRDGDRTRGSRRHNLKLQDWLVDHKVPRYLREWLPLVAIDDEIRWVIGLDMTEFPDSKSNVHLQLERDV